MVRTRKYGLVCYDRRIILLRAVRFRLALLLCVATVGCGTQARDQNAAREKAGIALPPARAQSAKPTLSPEGPKSPPPRPAALDQPQVVRMELMGQAGTEPSLGYGNCQWLYPRDAPQEKLLEEPRYKSGKPVYYAARYGDASDNVYTLVLDESGGTGKGYDVLYVDLNNDNRIDVDKERFAFRLGTTAKADPVRIRLLVAARGVAAPYCVSFSAFPYSDASHPIRGIHANLRNSSYYGGEAIFHGKKHRIAIADLNSNGLFNDVEQRLFQGDRFFVDLNDDGQCRNDRTHEESFPYGGYTRIDGDWYSMVASPDGSRVEIASAHHPLGKIKAPAQIGRALLVSAAQTLRLDFEDGYDWGVAGDYRIDSVELLAEDEPPRGWALAGSFGDKSPELAIRVGESSRLVAGCPLQVEARAVRNDKAGEGTVDFSLLITGIGGETYRWSRKDSSTPKAGFQIVDASGREIASQEFEYG